MAVPFSQPNSPGNATDKEREAASWRASTSATVSKLMEIVRQHDAQLRGLRSDHDALREEANSLRRSLEMFNAGASGKKSPVGFRAPNRGSPSPSVARSATGMELATRVGTKFQDFDPASSSSSGVTPRRHTMSPAASRMGSSSETTLALRRRNSDSGSDKAHKGGGSGGVDLWNATKPLVEPGSSKEQQITALNCFKQALKAGVSPHSWHGPGTPLRTAVEAGRLDMVTELLKARASPEESDTKGVSLLHLAAFSDKKEVCRALLTAKAHCNTMDQHGQTPLFFAPSRIICDVLYSKKADTNIVNNKGQSALHFAGQAGMSEVLLWLSQHVSPAVLDLRDDYNATGSYYAKAAGVKPEIYHRLQSGSQVADRTASQADRRLPTVLEEDSDAGTPKTPKDQSFPTPESQVSSGEDSPSERSVEDRISDELSPASRVQWQTLSAARDNRAKTTSSPSSAPSDRRLQAERAARPKAAWGGGGGTSQAGAMRVAAARASAQTPQARNAGKRPVSPPPSPPQSNKDVDEEALGEAQQEEESSKERRPAGVTHRPLQHAKQAQQAANRDEIKARAMRMKNARDGQPLRSEAAASSSRQDSESKSIPAQVDALPTNPQSPQSDDIDSQEYEQERYEVAAEKIQAAFRRRSLKDAPAGVATKNPLQGSKLGALRERDAHETSATSPLQGTKLGALRDQEAAKTADAGSSERPRAPQSPRERSAVASSERPRAPQSPRERSAVASSERPMAPPSPREWQSPRMAKSSKETRRPRGEVDESMAATALQAVVRGRLARKSIGSMKKQIVRQSEPSSDQREEPCSSPRSTNSEEF